MNNLLVRTRAALLAARLALPAAATLGGCQPTALPDEVPASGSAASALLTPSGSLMFPGTSPVLGAFRAVAVGDDHACALNSAGVLYCWGDKMSLATGEPVTPPASLAAPLPVASSQHFTAMVAGQSHACGLSASGDAVCWGDNGFAQVGANAVGSPSLPALVPGGHVFTALAAGNAFTCGLDTNQDLWCWGSNGNGGLGANAGPGNSGTPLKVVIGTGATVKFTQIVAGGQHACALDTNDFAWCWGSNYYGELGFPVTTIGPACGANNFCSPVAAQVVGTGGKPLSLQWSSLGAGDSRTCGVALSGATLCWGGSLRGTSQPYTSWDSVVSGSHTFATLSLGPTHSCALTTTGDAWCWGSNSSGELGNGMVLPSNMPNQYDPVQVTGGHVFSSITAGGRFTCALDTAGATWCWGQGANDQLAANQSLPALSSTPVAMASAMRFMSVAGGALDGTGAFACAIQRTASAPSAGAAYCWGNFLDKELGITRSESCIGGRACRTTPVPVARGLSFSALALGSNHSCALDASGNVFCVGENGYGELGRGNFAGSCPFSAGYPCASDAAPVALGGHHLGAIAGGGHHTCGIESSTGVAFCWGADTFGQLGSAPQSFCSTGTCSATPAPISGDTFRALAAGWQFTCGLDVNNAVVCWGENGGGQLGNTSAGGTALQAVALPSGTPNLVTAGYDHACAQTYGYNAKIQANVYTTTCWGKNSSGQLGNGTTSTTPTPPTAVIGAPGYFVALAAGQGFTCGIGAAGPPWVGGAPTSGGLFCWGAGIGGGATSTTPTQLAANVSFRALSTKFDTVCGITTKGTTMCFGGGLHGELGVGTQSPSATPVQVLGD